VESSWLKKKIYIYIYIYEIKAGLLGIWKGKKEEGNKELIRGNEYAYIICIIMNSLT
jgi:hypothetical protein